MPHNVDWKIDFVNRSIWLKLKRGNQSDVEILFQRFELIKNVIDQNIDISGKG